MSISTQMTPTQDHTSTRDDSGAIVPLDVSRLIEQINALQPGKQQQKTAQFQKLYPTIEHALGRQVPQKAIVEQLTSMGLRLSIGGFRSLLEAERKLRAEKGGYVHCEHCGSILAGSSDASNPVGPTSLASLVSRDAAMERNV